MPTLTREERRSLFLHQAIAEKLLVAPEDVLRRAGQNLQRILVQHPDASVLLEEWERILDRPVNEIVDVMIDPRQHARELRHVTPFAGVLTTAERSRTYREISAEEAKR